jgi:hypothetical protein
VIEYIEGYPFGTPIINLPTSIAALSPEKVWLSEIKYIAAGNSV